MFALDRRRVAGALISTALVVGLSSCGGGASSGSVDADALLRDAAKNALVAEQDANTLDMTVDLSGKAEDADDDELRGLDGKISLALRGTGLKGVATGKLPTLAISGSVDGTLTNPSGSTSGGKYAAGLTLAGEQVYVNWKGEDYAVGEELSQQFAAGFRSTAGGGPNAPDLNIDAAKAAKALDLSPDTWFTDPKVTDGPEIGGAETYAVGGPVNVKAAADDLTTGLRNLGKAFPQVAGMEEYASLKDISAADLKKVEDALSVSEAKVYITKKQHTIRGVSAHLVGEDKKDKFTFDITLDVRATVNGKVEIAAPKQANPITDLLLRLQREFPGLGNGASLLG